MNRSIAGLAAALLVMILSGSAGAQNCGYFGTENCGANDHWVTGDPPTSDSAHAHCMGPCAPGSVCHPTCRVELFVANPKLKAGYEAVFMAANSGDVALVLRLAARAPGFVAFNRTRRAVQLKGCGGEFVAASLPVRSPALLQLAMRLPNRAQILASAVSPRTGGR